MDGNALATSSQLVVMKDFEWCPCCSYKNTEEKTKIWRSSSFCSDSMELYLVLCELLYISISPNLSTPAAKNAVGTSLAEKNTEKENSKKNTRKKEKVAFPSFSSLFFCQLHNTTTSREKIFFLLFARSTKKVHKVAKQKRQTWEKYFSLSFSLTQNVAFVVLLVSLVSFIIVIFVHYTLFYNIMCTSYAVFPG